MSKTGIKLITKERQKQIDKYSFTGKHHKQHTEWYDSYQLQESAVILLSHDIDRSDFTVNDCPHNWDESWFRSLNLKSRKKRLIMAGALIAAELDRISE